MRNFAKLIAQVVLILAVITVIFRGAGLFHGWWMLVAFVGEVGFLLLVLYIYRWSKYPGLFQSRNGLFLLSQFLLALFTFTIGLLLLGIGSQIHFLGLFSSAKTVGAKLGLEFKYEKGSDVKVSAAAPKHLPWGQRGNIVGIHVVAKDDISSTALQPVGTVIYRVELVGGEIWEIPESELVSVDPL